MLCCAHKEHNRTRSPKTDFNVKDDDDDDDKNRSEVACTVDAISSSSKMAKRKRDLSRLLCCRRKVIYHENETGASIPHRWYFQLRNNNTSKPKTGWWWTQTLSMRLIFSTLYLVPRIARWPGNSSERLLRAAKGFKAAPVSSLWLLGVVCFRQMYRH